MKVKVAERQWKKLQIGGSERESEMGREGNGKVNFGERQWESRRE